MDSSAWLIRVAEEALHGPASRNQPPPLPVPADSAHGAAEQLEAILLAEAFGLPPPSREPIVHGKLLL